MQIGNYVRGKFIEIVIVWIVTYVTFALMGLQFSMLLGVLVGLSVVIPYVGAVTVTFPVAVIAYFQWGFTSDFAYIMIAYAIIQALDGNVLVPAAVLRGRQPAPDRDHHRGARLRRAVGILGCLLRNSARDPGAGGAEGMAVGSAGRRRGGARTWPE